MSQVRNPIARDWSSALMALQSAELTPGEASDQWFIDHFNPRRSCHLVFLVSMI